MKTTSFVFLALFCLVGVTSLASDDFSRFSLSEPVSGEPLVTDSVTGLVWQKTYATDYTWQEALAYCESLTYGGYSDWRLPNKKELLSLVNYEIYNPASDFPNTPTGYFWSSSTSAGFPHSAWNVQFYRGGGGGHDKSSYDNHYARCVREGS